MKKKKHKKSILHKKDGTCYLCVLLHENDYQYPYIHEHHIFPGSANRAISEANGFKVYLCPHHHEYSKEAAHDNREILEMLQQICKEHYLQEHTAEEFYQLFGRNFAPKDKNAPEKAAEPSGFYLLEDI